MAAWVKGDLGLFVADGGLPLETELDERPARPAERARQALELGREPATTKRASISSRTALVSSDVCRTSRGEEAPCRAGRARVHVAARREDVGPPVLRQGAALLVVVLEPDRVELDGHCGRRVEPRDDARGRVGARVARDRRPASPPMPRSLPRRAARSCARIDAALSKSSWMPARSTIVPFVSTESSSGYRRPATSARARGSWTPPWTLTSRQAPTSGFQMRTPNGVSASPCAASGSASGSVTASSASAARSPGASCHLGACSLRNTSRSLLKPAA